jgi:hypothetical protein
MRRTPDPAVLDPDPVLHAASTDDLILLLHALMRENVLKEPEDRRKGAILTLFKELYRRKVDVLGLMATAKRLQVPE